MSSLRHFAQQLDVSHTTILAALRGLSWVKDSTRERILQHMGRQDDNQFPDLPIVRSTRGIIVILRVASATCRCRGGVARHRAIVGAARKASRKLGYGSAQLVLGTGGLSRIPDIMRVRGYCGLLVLPGPNPEMLRAILPPSTPLIYTDTLAADAKIDCVCPDYHQGMCLTLARLRTKGIHKPGLILDCDLSLPAREQLIHAYGLSLSVAGIRTPAPFFTPTRSIENFDRWLKKHPFDSLLTTDPEYAGRLVSSNTLPVFGLDLNLGAVGRRAVERLHEQVRSPGLAPASPAVVTIPWTLADYAPSSNSSIG